MLTKEIKNLLRPVVRSNGVKQIYITIHQSWRENRANQPFKYWVRLHLERLLSYELQRPVDIGDINNNTANAVMSWISRFTERG
jgi:hypothetical protein